MVLLGTVQNKKLLLTESYASSCPQFFSALSFEIHSRNGNSWCLCMIIIHEKAVICTQQQMEMLVNV